MTAYFGNQCPERGPGLSHVINSQKGMNCIHCGGPVTTTPPQGVPEGATEASVHTWPTIFDHRYAAAITGRCTRCHKPEYDHVSYKTEGEPGECAVDHASIQPWTECPICFVFAEPKLATGEVKGPKHGPGRFPITERFKARLEALYGAWMHGYYES